ncbi:hypothetical protein C4568_04335 [Candidatus Parcubacteria bacterium]|nr:MAG: hypothetical protein C4568_04335 [Candidatus Parcubacteria bacterium]
MSHLSKHWHRLLRLLRKEHALVLGCAFAIVLVASFSLYATRESFSSAEVKFTDNSASGLSIMPASCPSAIDAHWNNECDLEGCVVSVSPSTITAGQTKTVTVSWMVGAPPIFNIQDSLIKNIRGWITGIGEVYPSGTLEIAAPSGPFDFTFSGSYYDALGNELDTFRCSTRLTVNDAPQNDLYINQVQLYRAPGSSVNPGDRIAYRLYVQTTGDQNWMIVRDRIPAHTTLIWQGGGTDNGNSCSQIPACVDGNGDVWWAQQYAPSGWSGYVDFTVQVNADAPSGTQICNVGRVESQEVAVKSSNQICNPVAQPPTRPTVSLTANGQTEHLTIARGENYTLYRNATNFTSCVLTNTRTDGYPEESPEHYAPGQLPLSTQTGLLGTYTLACEGPGGSASASVTIDASGPPVPLGYFDGASCSTLDGWAYDPKAPTRLINVHLYADKPPVPGDFSGYVGQYTTDRYRPDVNCAMSGGTWDANANACNGGDGHVTGNHGFSIPTPDVLKDGYTHTLYIYAINTDSSGPNPQLNQSPKTIQCTGNGCQLNVSPAELSGPGTVTLRASIDTFLMTNWTGTLTGVGAVGSDNPGPWSGVSINKTTDFTLQGRYTWFSIPMGSFSCSTRAIVKGDNNKCPNGDPAPDGDKSKCTCEQNLQNNCENKNKCKPPLTTRCSKDRTYYTQYDKDNNVCGDLTRCPYAAQGYLCIEPEPGRAYCPTPTQPGVKVGATPMLLHKNEKTVVWWHIDPNTSRASDEPINCTITGTNGDGPWTNRRIGGDTSRVERDSRPIVAQTIFTVSCVGEVTGRPIDSKSVTVNLIPDFEER